MGAMKAFIDDQQYFYTAGLEAGSEGNMVRLTTELENVRSSSMAYYNPREVDAELTASLEFGWAQGSRVRDARCPALAAV